MDNYSRVIILIGPDKAGKSTLAHTLLDNTLFQFRKGLKTKSFQETQELVTTFLQERQNTDVPIVCDRFHYPDELIYSALNHKQEVPEEYAKWFFDVVVPELKKLNTVFIYCYADVNTLRERFIASKETDIEAEWLQTLLNKYEEWLPLLESQNFPVLRLNSAQLDRNQMVSQTAAFLLYEYQNQNYKAGS